MHAELRFHILIYVFYAVPAVYLVAARATVRETADGSLLHGWPRRTTRVCFGLLAFNWLLLMATVDVLDYVGRRLGPPFGVDQYASRYLVGEVGVFAGIGCSVLGISLSRWAIRPSRMLLATAGVLEMYLFTFFGVAAVFGGMRY